MWERLKEWLQRRMAAGVQDGGAPLDDYVARYEDGQGENITAIIAGKLAMLSFADSALAVEDVNCPEAPGARVQLIRELLTELWHSDAGWITAQMLGKGGKLLLPTYDNGALHIRAVDQSRIAIREMDGSRIAAATLLADVGEVQGRQCSLLADYERSGGDQRICYRAVRSDGAPMPLDCVERWAGITPEIGVSGTDRLLLAYLRCPRDNRRERRLYGVPITYGAEQAIAELEEHGRIYRREYKLTRPMLGLDSSLWRSAGAQQVESGAEIDRLRRTVQDSDDPFVPFDSMSLEGRGIWQYYAPEIRYEAMDARQQMLLRRVERACGLSQGILTERQNVNYANRDEVRAAQYDTFSVVRAIRDEWERALEDLAYAIDVLAERFGITPAGARGQYRLRFDWDMSLIESTDQSFEQLRALHDEALLDGAELRQWVLGGSLRDNRQAIEAIREGRGGN